MKAIFLVCSFLLALSTIGLSAAGASEEIIIPLKDVELTPQLVVDLVLQRGSEVKKINAQTQLKHLEIDKELKNYDFSVSGGINYTDSKAASLSNFANQEEQTLGISTQLVKKVKYGTTLTAGYTRTSQSKILSSFLSSSNSDPVSLDIFTFQIDQDLWSNFLGLSQKLNLKVAETNAKSADLDRLESLEKLTLSTMKAFWDAYVAKENLNESLSARERYKKLVNVVIKKSKLGYAAPGELSQIRAEFEVQEQAVKERSAVYLNMVNKLEVDLKVKIIGEITFKVDSMIPEFPNLKPVNATELRPFLMAKNNLDSKNMTLKSKFSDNDPKLKLVAKGQLYGSGADGSKSFNDLSTGNRPLYYVGVELSKSFGDSTYNSSIGPAKIDADLAEIELKNTIDNLQYELSEKKRIAEARKLIAESSVKTYELSKSSARDIEKAYRQGRIKINDLILSLNKLYQSHTARTRAIGNYHIALNEWAAVRDELIRPSKQTGDM